MNSFSEFISSIVSSPPEYVFLSVKEMVKDKSDLPDDINGLSICLPYCIFFNDFVKVDEAIVIPILEISRTVHNEQVERLKKLRSNRNNDLVRDSLKAITDASSQSENLMPLIIDAAKSYATLGEIVNSMKMVFGEWKEPTTI